MESLSHLHCGSRSIWNFSTFHILPAKNDGIIRNEEVSDVREPAQKHKQTTWSHPSAADKTCKHRRWTQDLSGNMKQWDTLKHVGSLISSHTVSSQKWLCTLNPQLFWYYWELVTMSFVRQHWAPKFHFIRLEILVLHYNLTLADAMCSLFKQKCSRSDKQSNRMKMTKKVWNK